MIGLSTAMMLAEDGHEVTVLESDPSPVPDNPADAWAQWDRKGVAQFRQPHNLLSRARHVLDETLPGLTKALLEAGCTWVDPLSSLPPSLADQSKRPEDDRFRFITGRRPVVEATFASAADRHPGVTVRRGAVVRGLLSDGTHVKGVELGGGEQLRADLVVDAMGRRTKLTEWLEAMGAQPPALESEDAGFVYSTRYFEGPDQPITRGPALAPLGTISVLTIAGDNNTWSVTIFGASADKDLKALRDAEAFTRVINACPLQAPWLRGTPITDVLVMAGILDRHRTFVVEGKPIATGVVAVGDAWASTNPSAGKGMSVGLVHAQQLREAVRKGVDDTLELRFAELTEREVTPFFRNQIKEDRARFAEMDALRKGEDPAPADPAATAAAYDADVLRGVVDTAQCLAHHEEVYARPGFQEKVAAYANAPQGRLPGPTRAELLDLMRQPHQAE
jgi:2-polyprenyl-6-methoxyphenol hydroxylase-like FAD-dependent oxidoreductase